MKTASATLSIRADLVHKAIWIGSQKMWVVKDPLSRSYSYFNEQEYLLLSLADGNRTVAEIAAECQRLIAPQTVSIDSVTRFFTAAYTGGIVLIDGVGYRQPNQSASVRRWWRNPLAIRCPGINPDRFLDRLILYLTPSVILPIVAVSLLLMVIGLVLAATHFTDIAASIELASSKLLTGQGLVKFLGTIALTKIVHELAHAIVCKLFGGDVVEMGVMFLVGTPCLYCDVSDAWLLDRRWKRIMVSAAGILAELTLASIASIVWLFAVDGPVRDLSVIVMVVCSITTLLFNGNPLLRYDGYFILSDLIGIPNLAAESSKQVRQWTGRMVWGIAPDGAPSDRSCFLGIYGIASGLYRIILYSLIASMIYSIAKQYDMERMFLVLIAFAFGRLGWKWIRQTLTRPDHYPVGTPWRPTVIATGFGLTTLAILLIPLPQTVTAPLSIEPAGAERVFVTRPGRIVDSVEPGNQVAAGTIIARIQNRETERDLAAIGAQCDQLKIQLDSLRRNRQRGSSARIESIERTYAAALKQLSLQQQNARELELRTSCGGQIFLPRSYRSVAATDDQAEFWTGTPMELSNRGAWLTPGTIVCLIGDRSAREAILLLRQQQIELIRLEQKVTLRLADHHRGDITGQVVDIAPSPAEKIETELAIAGFIHPELSRQPPHYLVRVKLDDESIAIPIRTVGRAKIYVDRESIAKRIAKFLANAFG